MMYVQCAVVLWQTMSTEKLRLKFGCAENDSNSRARMHVKEASASRYQARKVVHISWGSSTLN